MKECAMESISFHLAVQPLAQLFGVRIYWISKFKMETF